MKRLLFFILFFSGIAFATQACSSDDSTDNREIPEPEPDPQPQPDGSRSVVIYFSCTNTTKGLAEQIAEIKGADTWQIQPEVAYTTADLNYNNSDSRANREQNDPSSRPAIKEGLENLSDYDVVFLGYPIWWGKAPKIISTFLENYDLSGKTIVPFCTSGSSGIGSSDTDLHPFASQATWKQGRRFSSNETKETITNWIDSLN